MKLVFLLPQPFLLPLPLLLSIDDKDNTIKIMQQPGKEK